MIRTVVLALTVMLTIGATAPTLADDFEPPPWRGGPLTVQAEWEFIQDFSDDPMNIAPDYFNAVGDGQHELYDGFTHAHANEYVYWEVDPNDPGDGRAFTGETPGWLDFFLVNWIDDYDDKYIWVQITYGGQGVPWVIEVVAPPWDDPFYGELLETIDWGPGYRIESWVLHPNPDREFVKLELPPFTWVDQVMIDTISTNEACEGDVDGDGDVDHSDLGALLGAWCLHEGDPAWDPNADLDGDGHIGHGDLGILLANWGCGVGP